MSKNTQSALQQAIFESEELKRLAAKNAKDILYAQLRPDLEKTIREQIEGEDDDDDQYDNKASEPAETGADDFGGETSVEVPAEEPEVAPEGSADEFGGGESPIEGGSSEDGEVPTAIAPEGGESPIEGGDDDTVDLTGASDEEVISVFKKLGDDAEIEIVPMGSNAFSVKDANGSEVIVKINEGEEDAVGSSPAGNVSVYKDPKEVSVKDSILEDEKDVVGSSPAGNVSVYKDPKEVNVKDSILEDEEPVEEGEDKYAFIDEDDMPSDKKEITYEIDMSAAPADNEEPIEEVARTHADGHKMERKPEGFFKYTTNRVRPAEQGSVNESEAAKDKVIQELEAKVAQMTEANTALTEDLEKHKTGLLQLRETLETVSTFNTKVHSLNKIITSHATTMDEKRAIAERFDAVETIKEAKALYKTISAELKTKGLVNETVENTINKNVSGNTGESLLESANPEINKHAAGLSRIQELISYSNKR